MKITTDDLRDLAEAEFTGTYPPVLIIDTDGDIDVCRTDIAIERDWRIVTDQHALEAYVGTEVDEYTETLLRSFADKMNAEIEESQ